MASLSVDSYSADVRLDWSRKFKSPLSLSTLIMINDLTVSTNLEFCGIFYNYSRQKIHDTKNSASRLSCFPEKTLFCRLYCPYIFWCTDVKKLFR